MLRREQSGAAAHDPKLGRVAGTIEAVGRTETDLDAHPIAPVDDVTPAPRRGARIVAWITRYWLLLALLVGAAVLSVVVRHVVYPALSWNRDESTYLWQVGGLRAGDLLSTTGGLPG